jgi:hypothetical protein
MHSNLCPLLTVSSVIRDAKSEAIQALGYHMSLTPYFFDAGNERLLIGGSAEQSECGSRVMSLLIDVGRVSLLLRLVYGQVSTWHHAFRCEKIK